MNATAISAENTIRRVVDETQSKLDSAAASARAESIRSLRAAALSGVSPDSDMYPIASLVSQTLSVGRECDGYPNVSIPKATREIVEKAVRADILAPQPDGRIKIGETVWYSDLSGMPDTLMDDYNAWNAAKTYRNRNKS